MAGNWEWVLEGLFLCLLIAELISVRRSIRRARDAPPGAAPPPTSRE